MTGTKGCHAAPGRDRINERVHGYQLRPKGCHAAPGRERIRRAPGAWPRAGWLWLLVVALLVPGCQQNQVATPTRYLERPNAIDFFCLGPVGTEAGQDVTALPPYACAPDTEGSEQRTLLALVPNSSRSEVAVVNISGGALVDLANENPGYGFVPVGEMPVAVKVTEDGCAGYVANYGSCDLSVLNTNAVLHAAGYRILEAGLHGAPSGRIAIRSASGRLLVRPVALALRRENQTAPPPVQACGPIAGHRAYVSLPSCGLVAEVSLDSGRILQSVRLGAGGAVIQAGIDPACPADCVDYVGDGVAEGTLAEHRPGPLLVTEDGLRLLVGWSSEPQVTVVEIDPSTGAWGRMRTLSLADEDQGVLRIREVYTATHGWHFFYVISRSGVAHVLDAETEQECETNPDPQDPFFPADASDPAEWAAWETRKGCLPLGDPETPVRAPGIRTPGIRVPGHRKVIDVAFVEISADDYADSSLTTLDPRYLVGTFAYLLTEDGMAYLVNVDEAYSDTMDPGASDTPLQFRRGDGVHAILSHQLRDAVNRLPDESGHARPADEQKQTLYVAGEAVEDNGAHDKVTETPSGEPDVTVLDRYRVASEVWSLRYMGVLPLTNRTRGQVIRHDLSGATQGEAELVDPGVSFCRAGVRDGDVLVLSGCTSDSQCNDGEYCFRSFVQAPESGGICLPSDIGPSLEGVCEPLAVSRREYDIQWAGASLVWFASRQEHDATFCPEAEMPEYCCDEQGNAVGVRDGGRCLAGPLPDIPLAVTLEDGTTVTTHCLAGLRSYEIRVSDGQYLLSGSATGTLVSGVPDESDGGHCVDDPEMEPVVHARVPRSEEPFRNTVIQFALSLASGAAVSPLEDDAIQFEIVAGFSAQGVDVSARLPACVLSAPDGYLYVVDEGDDSSPGGLQGQVLRLLPGDVALDTGFVVR